MAIIIIPRRWIRQAAWRQPPVYNLQRSEWTGRTRVIKIGPAARWICDADLRPSNAADLPMWRAFAARMMTPGNVVRLPATEGSQYGPNLIRRPDGTGWNLIGVGITQGPATDAAPLPRTIRALPDASQRLAFEKFAQGVPAAPGDVRYLAASVLRETATSGGNILLRALWRDAGAAVIGNIQAVGDLVPVGQWTRVYASGTAPASTASVSPSAIFANTAGIAQVTDFALFDRPEIASVSGAGQTGISLNVNGLAPNLLHLRAGNLVTVPLPGGDEQLLALTADVVANGSGEATLQFATPMRKSPADNSIVELSRPWALMRALDPLAWDVRPGPVYTPAPVRFEEAF